MPAHTPSLRSRRVVRVAALTLVAGAGVFAAMAIHPETSAATTKVMTIVASNNSSSMSFYDGTKTECLTQSATFSEPESQLIDTNTFSSSDCSGTRITHCLTTVPRDLGDNVTLTSDTCRWSRTE